MEVLQAEAAEAGSPGEIPLPSRAWRDLRRGAARRHGEGAARPATGGPGGSPAGGGRRRASALEVCAEAVEDRQ